MDNENQRRFESVFSKRVRAGKRRTYFFDVRRTKGDDFYLTLTESTRRFNGEGYDRHKIFLYKEDFNRFMSNLEEVINHVKVELMPDYDYDEYTRRHEEYEARRAAGEFDNPGDGGTESSATNAEDATDSSTEITDSSTEITDSSTEITEEETESPPVNTEDDMSW